MTIRLGLRVLHNVLLKVVHFLDNPKNIVRQSNICCVKAQINSRVPVYSRRTNTRQYKEFWCLYENTLNIYESTNCVKYYLFYIVSTLLSQKR